MRSSTWWMIGGILSIIGGLFALFNPMAGTLAATLVAAWAFILAGVLQIVAAFNVSGGWNKLFLILFGLVGVIVGFVVIGNPLAGAMSLTMAVAILFLISGVVKLFGAKDVKGTSAYGWVIVSAIASLLLGVLIFANFPVSAVSILGILLGVNLIFDGVAMIGWSNAAKRIEGVVQAA
nr:DUF308 domain-containing protein [uncultured Sphingomonas sp.]